MHHGLSVSKRSHATSGIVMAGKDLGMLECVLGPANREDNIVHLGLNHTAFKLKPRSECSGVEKLVDKFIDYANVAKIKWPCQDEEWKVFAGDVFGLMVYFHALEVDSIGLSGGKTLVPNSKKKASVGQPGPTRLRRSHPEIWLLTAKSTVTTSSSTSRGISFSRLTA